MNTVNIPLNAIGTKYSDPGSRRPWWYFETSDNAFSLGEKPAFDFKDGFEMQQMTVLEACISTMEKAASPAKTARVNVKHDFDKVDWNLSNKELAATTGIKDTYLAVKRSQLKKAGKLNSEGKPFAQTESAPAPATEAPATQTEVAPALETKSETQIVVPANGITQIEAAPAPITSPAKKSKGKQLQTA